MKNLNDASVEELQKELERRNKIHKFKIDEVEFELTLDQIKKLQKELEKINPVPSSINEWKKFVERQNDIPVIPPGKFPYNPNNPFPTFPAPDYSKDKIWCLQQHPNNLC